MIDSYRTLAQRHGVTALPLADRRPTPTTPIRVVSGNTGEVFSCTIERLPYRLLESAYVVEDAVAYSPECTTGPGTSGSPVISDSAATRPRPGG